MKKNLPAFVFLVTSLVFGYLWLGKRQSISELGLHIASLEVKLKEQARQFEERKRITDWLIRQRTELQLELAKLYSKNSNSGTSTNSSPLATDTATGNSPDGASPGDSAGARNALAQMLQNPEMKKMMEQQQRMSLETLYRALFKDLNFSPAESETFVSLMVERDTKGMEAATAFFGKDPLTGDEVLKKEAADHQAYEEKIKAFLGEERYAKYVDYNETAGERMLLNQFGSVNSVNEDQTRQLLDVMKEQKRRMKTESIDLLNSIPDFQAFPSEEEINRLMQHQEVFNGRVLEGAKGVLTSPQLEAFRKHLADQVQMGRSQLNAARSVIGGGQGTPGSVPSR